MNSLIAKIQRENLSAASEAGPTVAPLPNVPSYLLPQNLATQPQAVSRDPTNASRVHLSSDEED